jgi:hypothetical protein
MHLGHHFDEIGIFHRLRACILKLLNDIVRKPLWTNNCNKIQACPN